MNKILIVAPDFHPAQGGVENYLLNLTKNLSNQYNIEIFSGTRISPKISKTYLINDFLVNKYKTFKIFGIDFPVSFFTYFKLFKAIKNSDIVFVNDVKVFFFSIVFFSKLLNKKTFLVTHGLIFHNKRYVIFKKFFIKIYLYIIKNLITKVVANGMIDHQFLLKNNINSNLINNGISIEKFKCKRSNVKNYFVYFGRLTSNKGIDNLIDFLFTYKKKSLNFKMIIMGTGDNLYTEFLMNKINNMNLSENVKLFGEFTHDELLEELSKSEFVFNPSKFESFGFTLIEALAAGCTIIASDIDQYKFINNESGAFYTIDFDDINFVLNTIDVARSDYKNINLKAENLAKKYSIKKTNEEYLKALNEISQK
jgi:alpha-1,3-mannosyltransferase